MVWDNGQPCDENHPTWVDFEIVSMVIVVIGAWIFANKLNGSLCFINLF